MGKPTGFLEIERRERSYVKAAERAYGMTSIPFVSLIEAQRNQVDLLDRYYTALADYHRRRWELQDDRARREEKPLNGPKTRKITKDGLARGAITHGSGRGGSVRRVEIAAFASTSLRVL